MTILLTHVIIDDSIHSPMYDLKKIVMLKRACDASFLKQSCLARVQHTLVIGPQSHLASRQAPTGVIPDQKALHSILSVNNRVGSYINSPSFSKNPATGTNGLTPIQTRGHPHVATCKSSNLLKTYNAPHAPLAMSSPIGPHRPNPPVARSCAVALPNHLLGADQQMAKWRLPMVRRLHLAPNMREASLLRTQRSSHRVAAAPGCDFARVVGSTR